MSAISFARFPVVVALASLGAVAQPEPRKCGIVGCTEHGNGAIVSRRVDARQVVVEFEVGSSDSAPYARERLTVSPEMLHHGTALIVDFNPKSERLAAKIPGSMGAFWEIDLQNQEDALLQKVFLEVGGKPVAPSKGDARHAEFEVGADSKGPYVLLLRVGFFGTSDVIRFKAGAKEQPVRRRMS